MVEAERELVQVRPKVDSADPPVGSCHGSRREPSLAGRRGRTGRHLSERSATSYSEDTGRRAPVGSPIPVRTRASANRGCTHLERRVFLMSSPKQCCSGFSVFVIFHGHQHREGLSVAFLFSSNLLLSVSIIDLSYFNFVKTFTINIFVRHLGSHGPTKAFAESKMRELVAPECC